MVKIASSTFRFNSFSLLHKLSILYDNTIDSDRPIALDPRLSSAIGAVPFPLQLLTIKLRRPRPRALPSPPAPLECILVLTPRRRVPVLTISRPGDVRRPAAGPRRTTCANCHRAALRFRSRLRARVDVPTSPYIDRRGRVRRDLSPGRGLVSISKGINKRT
ncbi:hypothetical protein EVAR_96020_1 [Eumeta japonica]|uniref:Uncharacterized protein n=1 Tax=Eumeta variegata TaxID=151549 RepID=A0A4C1XD57_EUMVA|nr:hypothetical protein EVAR_96020_1 [Eumeta japonica]